jgi:ACT domain-containing protein
MTLPATDAFTRANGALGSNWAGSVGSDLSITSNEVTGASGADSSMYWSADSFSNAQRSKCTLKAISAGQYAGPIVRANGTDFVVLVAQSNTDFQIQWYNGGVWTQIGSTYSATPAANDVLEIIADGSNFYGYINGVLQISGSNGSAPASGACGLYVYSNSAHVDDFEADNYSAPWDGYPSLDAGASTNGTTLSGGVALNMPSGSDELLIAFTGNDAPGTTNMGMSGWTEIFAGAYTGDVIKFKIFAKLASGTDSGTLTGASQDYVARVLRIGNHGVSNIATDIKVGTVNSGSSAAPDATSLDAGSTKKWLWIAANVSDDDDNTTPYAPTNYTADAQVESAQSTSSCMLQVAYRKNETQTENPGAFALAATEEWLAVVIAIPPASSGLSATIGQVTETDLAQALSKRKTKAVAQASETDLAQALTRQRLRAIAQVSEADTAQAMARQKLQAIAQVTETDLAQPVSRLVTTITVQIGQVTETDAAQTMTRLKAKAIAQVTETDTAQAMSRRKQKAIGQVSETDLAQAMSRRKQKTIAQATETDTAQAMTRRKVKIILQVTETDLAQSVTRRKTKTIGQASETDTAQPVTSSGIKTVIIGQVTETDLAQAMNRLKRLAIAQATETDTAQSLTRRKVKAIAQVSESDSAQAMIRLKLRSIGQVTETDLAQALFRRKVVTIGQAGETDTAQAVTAVLGALVRRLINVDSVAVETVAGVTVLREQLSGVSELADLLASAGLAVDWIGVESRSAHAVAVQTEDVP